MQAHGRPLRFLARASTWLDLLRALENVRWRAAAAAVVSIVAAVATLLIPFVLGRVLDGVLRSGSGGAIAPALVVFGVLAAIALVTRLVAFRLAAGVGGEVAVMLQRRMWATFCRQPLHFFRVSGAGGIAHVVTTDVDAVAQMVPVVVRDVFTNLVTVALGFGLLVAFDWRLAVIVVPYLLALAVVLPLDRSTRIVGKDIVVAQQEMAGFVAERMSYDAQLTARVYGTGARDDEALTGRSVAVADLAVGLGRKVAGLSTVLGLAGLVTLGVTLGVGTWLVAQGAASPGQLITALLLARLLDVPIQGLVESRYVLVRGLAALAKVMGILRHGAPERPGAEIDGGGEVARRQGEPAVGHRASVPRGGPPRLPRRRTVVELVAVSFRYPASEEVVIPGLPVQAQAGLRGPNAQAGLRGPNAQAGLRGPNAQAGLRGPNAQAGLRGPNAQDGPDAGAVVHDLDLLIRRGEMVALVGRSGAGKTTVAHLAAGLYTPTSGTVTFSDPATGQPRDRPSLAYVAQDAFLYHDTLRANVAVGASAPSERELIKACIAAGVHPFVMRFANGYNTLVGERGQRLSGGERQRVALARALVSPADLIVLDEATSQVDGITERVMQSSLDALRAERACLVVAHRLATVRSADRIVVLDGGRVVETGTHDELVDEAGLYAELAKTQLEA